MLAGGSFCPRGMIVLEASSQKAPRFAPINVEFGLDNDTNILLNGHRSALHDNLPSHPLQKDKINVLEANKLVMAKHTSGLHMMTRSGNPKEIYATRYHFNIIAITIIIYRTH